MVALIDRQFGTWRGAVRLGLSYGEVAAWLAPVRRPHPLEVRRLVFVCHGNICRSAFAEAVARQQGCKAASFGLSTTSGHPAFPDVARLADARGVSLDEHVTTDISDYRPLPGDYLLAMEVRQLRKLAADERVNRLPRGLLGSYARLPVPHLHDPYGLDLAYMEVCLDRIDDAVTRACRKYPNARIS